MKWNAAVVSWVWNATVAPKSMRVVLNSFKLSLPERYSVQCTALLSRDELQKQKKLKQKYFSWRIETWYKCFESKQINSEI